MPPRRRPKYLIFQYLISAPPGHREKNPHYCPIIWEISSRPARRRTTPVHQPRSRRDRRSPIPRALTVFLEKFSFSPPLLQRRPSTLRPRRSRPQAWTWRSLEPVLLDHRRFPKFSRLSELDKRRNAMLSSSASRASRRFPRSKETKTAPSAL